MLSSFSRSRSFCSNHYVCVFVLIFNPIFVDTNRDRELTAYRKASFKD